MARRSYRRSRPAGRRRAYEWARFQTGFNLTSTNMASGFSNMLQDYEQVLAPMPLAPRSPGSVGGSPGPTS